MFYIGAVFVCGKDCASDSSADACYLVVEFNGCHYLRYLVDGLPSMASRPPGWTLGDHARCSKWKRYQAASGVEGGGCYDDRLARLESAEAISKCRGDVKR